MVESPVRPSNKMETLIEWAHALKSSKKCIIVEGRKDKKALEQLGMQKIIMFSNAPHYSLETIEEKEVVILTDLDRHGRKLYKIAKQNLQARGIKIDRKFREFLIRETKVMNIESLKNINIYDE